MEQLKGNNSVVPLATTKCVAALVSVCTERRAIAAILFILSRNSRNPSAVQSKSNNLRRKTKQFGHFVSTNYIVYNAFHMYFEYHNS